VYEGHSAGAIPKREFLMSKTIFLLTKKLAPKIVVPPVLSELAWNAKHNTEEGEGEELVAMNK
jgi:hypothetical protein